MREESTFIEVWAETGEKFLPNNKWLGVKGCWLSWRTPSGLLLIEVEISSMSVLNSKSDNLKFGSILKEDFNCLTIASTAPFLQGASVGWTTNWLRANNLQDPGQHY